MRHFVDRFSPQPTRRPGKPTSNIPHYRRCSEPDRGRFWDDLVVNLRDPVRWATQSNSSRGATTFLTFTQPDTSRYSKAGQPLDIHASPTSVTPSHPFTLSRWSPGQPSPNAFDFVGRRVRGVFEAGLWQNSIAVLDRGWTFVEPAV